MGRYCHHNSILRHSVVAMQCYYYVSRDAIINLGTEIRNRVYLIDFIFIGIAIYVCNVAQTVRGFKADPVQCGKCKHYFKQPSDYR